MTGTGCHPDILLSAGIEDADMLVSVTNSDEINIAVAKLLIHIQYPKKIARGAQEITLLKIIKICFFQILICQSMF